jgi:hypothetical protein
MDGPEGNDGYATARARVEQDRPAPATSNAAPGDGTATDSAFKQSETSGGTRSSAGLSNQVTGWILLVVLALFALLIAAAVRIMGRENERKRQIAEWQQA